MSTLFQNIAFKGSWTLQLTPDDHIVLRILNKDHLQLVLTIGRKEKEVRWCNSKEVEKAYRDMYLTLSHDKGVEKRIKVYFEEHQEEFYPSEYYPKPGTESKTTCYTYTDSTLLNKYKCTLWQVQSFMCDRLFYNEEVVVFKTGKDYPIMACYPRWVDKIYYGAGATQLDGTTRSEKDN